MMDLCIRQSVDIAIPLVDEESALFKAANPSKVLTPTETFIRACLDKRELMRVLGGIGVTVPRTYNRTKTIDDTAPFDLLYPWVIKPRTGRGSRGVAIIRSRQEGLAHAETAGYLDALIIQEYIDGPEYTVSVVCDQRNTVHAVVPKEIIDKRGSTRLAVTRRNKAIDQVCRDIAEKLNPCGPFNVQLRMRDGVPYVFEINPRFSGTVNLTIAAGCDEVGGLIELALGRPYTFGEWREGVVLVRQTHDGIMSEADFKERAPKGWNA